MTSGPVVNHEALAQEQASGAAHPDGFQLDLYAVSGGESAEGCEDSEEAVTEAEAGIATLLERCPWCVGHDSSSHAANTSAYRSWQKVGGRPQSGMNGGALPMSLHCAKKPLRNTVGPA